ncbi:MAG: tetratricopeptide repeat protein [Candidatus Cloacimonetes bacterium]|nr:tetratricopeptide repeat protein [Candidatus Cloacimonadota bacterium]
MDIKALFHEGLDLYRKELFQEAIKRWTVVESMDKNYPNIKMYINVAERQELNTLSFLDSMDPGGEADVDLINVVEQSRLEFQNFIKLGKSEEATNLLDTLLFERESDPDALTFLIQANFELQRKDKSLEIAERLIKIRPYWAKSFFIHGNICFQMQYFMKAKKSYLFALKLRPNSFQLLSNLGSCCANLNEVDEARSYFQRALDIKPNDARSKNMIARLDDSSQKLEEEILKHYEQLNLENDYPDILLKIGILQRKLGKIEEAYQSVKKSLSKNEIYVEAHYEMGKILLLLEQYEEAYESFYKVVKLQEKEFIGLANILEFVKVGYFEEAALGLVKILRMEPDYGSVHINLAKEYYDCSNIEKAIEELNKGLSISPAYPDGYYYLGLCYQSLGDMDKAVENFKESLELNPMYLDAGLALSNIYMDKNENRNARRLLQMIEVGLEENHPAVKEIEAKLKKLI